ncbi:cation-translocating P-type ATPase [Bifidobacterium tissieri]|uniref:Cation-translocating P-type ATPase n=2 Tax=Bifidobacterium tissieri TaxID=1630162 RepID=A0A5M9ZR82_9BIFI|nr:cation-translocating P-type ATPase [Bifidobacterium tissieri]KAA8831300.1 cation-translocating P-type ATPase [Bifidobacterium tissieri]
MKDPARNYLDQPDHPDQNAALAQTGQSTATQLTTASAAEAKLIPDDPSQIDSATVAAGLNTDIERGLSSEEAARRLAEFGPNELAGAPPTPKWKKFLAQFKDPLVYLLLAATAISLIAWFIERANNPAEAEALPFDCIVIVLILVLNAVLGYAQEAKAEQAVAALSRMAAAHATVFRDGQPISIPTAEVVPGDIVLLAEGDTVAADGRLAATAALHIAEASLTGESVPVTKNPATLTEAKALGDRTNMAFNGTSVTQGTGRLIVTATGMRTQVGKIARMLSEQKEDPTPLQKEIAFVSKVLGLAVCVIAALVLVLLAVVYGFNSTQDVIDSLLLAVSLAVAAVPEGLAAILTVVLALGVQRMAKHHAIVKKLSSVETLGSASVICSDKTGTLTRNEMTVQRVITPSGEIALTGTGYSTTGVATTIDGGTLSDDDPRLREARHTLLVGAIANDGKLNDDGTIVGDPTEVSLIVGARKISGAGTDRSGLGQSDADQYVRVAEIPFTSDRKRMTVIAQKTIDTAEALDSSTLDSGMLTAYAKGAPDVLLEYCTRIEENGTIRALTDADRARILADVERLSRNAYRTLGQAYRPLNASSIDAIDGLERNADGALAKDIADQPDAIEHDMIWTGMVGIIDPPRTEVRDAVAEAHGAGVRTVMITGDHPLTAARIATDLGIITADDGSDSTANTVANSTANLTPPQPQALTGDQLDRLTDAEFADAVRTVSVYARVAPEHKMRIVDALQEQGEIVAMTGDGVNDAPAVKSADIGVAMGITGTEVTKESAKMILTDDNFGTIVAAVREGRSIFDNIRKFLRYLLSSNMGEVLTVFGGVLLAGFLGISEPGADSVTVPLLATQLLWINLLTDAAPAMAMGVDPSTENVMNRKPRKLTDRVIDARMWSDVIVVGLLMAAVTLIGMDLYLPGGLLTDDSAMHVTHDEQIVMARTMGFTILVFAQLFNALAARSADQTAFRGMFSNKWLWGAIALSIVLQLLVIYVPFLNVAFGTTPLDPHQWLECLGLAALVLVGSEIYKFVLRTVGAVRS